MGVKLTEIANVIRSKNAGPYELTFDIIFKSSEWYNKIKKSGVIDKNLISRLYNVEPDIIMDIIEFDPAFAVKITIKRPIVSGDIGESDVYGAQQHAPLLELEFDNL